MNWQEFEEQLKGRVEGHETPIDTEALWAKVEPRRRRRFLLFFWWILGAAGLMGGAYWMTGHLSQPATAHASQEESQPDIRTSDVAPVLLASRSAFTISASQTNLTTPNTNSQKTTGAIQTLQHQDKHTGKGTVQAVHLSADQAAAGAAKSVANIGSEPTALQMPAPVLRADIDMLPTYIHFLPAATDEFILPESFVSPYAPLFAVPANSHYQLGIQSGISYWNVLHPSGPDAVFPRANERLLEAVHLGAFYQKQMGRRLIIRAGLQYQRYNAVFRWQTSSTASNQPQQVLNYYSDGRIDTTFIPGGALVEITRTVRHYNRVSSLMLPLDFKWRIPAGRTTLMPFLGVQAGIQSQSGALLNANGQPDFGRYKSIYKTLFNLGLRTGISTEWRINERNHLLIEPWGCVDLRSRTGRFNPAYEQFWQAGLSVGVVRMMNDE